MTPGIYDIKIQRGATFELVLTATDTMGVIAFNSTYNKAELLVFPNWVKEKGIHIPPLLTLNNTLQSITLTANAVILKLSAEETSLIKFNEGIYELKLRNILTNPVIVDTILEGSVFVKGLA